MAKSINAILVVLAAVLLVPVASYAAGLGTITVRSALGQPFDAEIEVVGVQAGEDFQVRLASREAYRDAGIDPSPALQGARFAIERRDGKTLIRVRTSQPVNDPFFSVMVELQWPTGRLSRQYTVLVDPAEYRTASKPPQPVAAAPAPAVAPVAAAPAPVRSPAPTHAPLTAPAPAAAPAPVAVAAPALVAAPTPAPAAPSKPAQAAAEAAPAPIVATPPVVVAQPASAPVAAQAVAPSAAETAVAPVQALAPAAAPAPVAASAPAPAPKTENAVVATPTPVPTPMQQPAIAAPAPAAVQPVAVAPAAPAAALQVAQPTPVVSAPVRATPAPAAVAQAPAQPAPAVAATPSPQRNAEPSDTYRIRRGDTLGGIARKWRPEGVTYDQMLMGLYQINRPVFIRDNINLIRAGAMLFIPGREDVLAINAVDATHQVRMHMAAFTRHRDTAVGAGTGSDRISQAQREGINRRAVVKRSTRAM